MRNYALEKASGQKSPEALNFIENRMSHKHITSRDFGF